MTAYEPALVGAVEDSSYITLLTLPATEPVTVATLGEPSYETGELVTEIVGVALFRVIDTGPLVLETL